MTSWHVNMIFRNNFYRGLPRRSLKLILQQPIFLCTMNCLLFSVNTVQFNPFCIFSAGEEGLGERVLEKIKTPLELFDVLRQRTFVDRNNMIYLQAMLYHIGRKDLLDLAVEYAHACKDVIHYKSPPPEPGKIDICNFQVSEK